MGFPIRASAFLCSAAVLTCCVTLSGDAVAVRQPEGELHGFLALRTMDGTTIADGEMLQSVREGKVTTRVVFHFKDGSLDDETAVYSQGRDFHLLNDTRVQKGPAFPVPLTMTINGDGN